MKKRNPSLPTFGERLRFAIWLSAKNLGTESAKELSEVLGKKQGQISSWIKEDPRPAYENIKLIAERIGISAAWLDDPLSPDAREPELWPEWFAARRGRDDQRRRA